MKIRTVDTFELFGRECEVISVTEPSWLGKGIANISIESGISTPVTLCLDLLMWLITQNTLNESRLELLDYCADTK